MGNAVLSWQGDLRMNQEENPSAPGHQVVKVQILPREEERSALFLQLNRHQ